MKLDSEDEQHLKLSEGVVLFIGDIPTRMIVDLI
jgi:hypothetical protein